MTASVNLPQIAQHRVGPPSASDKKFKISPLHQITRKFYPKIPSRECRKCVIIVSYPTSGCNMSGVRIVVADCSPVFLRGLTIILRSEHTFEVVASCCDGMESLQAIRDLSTDIALFNSC